MSPLAFIVSLPTHIRRMASESPVATVSGLRPQANAMRTAGRTVLVIGIPEQLIAINDYAHARGGAHWLDAPHWGREGCVLMRDGGEGD